MRKNSVLFGALLGVFAFSAGAFAAEKFTVESAAFKAGDTLANAQVFKGFGCEGGNVSPALAWKNAPKGTKSFAVTVYDPDAPTGSGWWHWTVFNIPANVASLAEGAGSGKGLPAGAKQGRTDFGSAGYGGPCPPKGDKPHRYIFAVHALKVEKIDLDENASGALVGFMLNANRLARTTLVGKYGR